MPGASSFVVAVVLAVTFGVGAAGPRTTGASAPRPVGPPADSSSTANVSVAIDPASWWMQTGENVTFSATWADVPAPCTVGPSWFRWAVAPGPSVGGLAVVNGSSATYDSGGQGAGTATITVRGFTSLACAGTVRPVDSEGTAVVTVALPLGISGLVARPNPVAPGSPTVLLGTVTGGDPPYGLRVEWGDGNVSAVNVSAPGPFSVSHVFASNGTYSPTVLATDAVGEDGEGTDDGTVEVSRGFSAGIVPSELVAEVGVPTTFSITLRSPPASFTSTLACGGNAEVRDNISNGTAYACVFRAAGLDPVTFEAIGSSPPYATAGAGLVEPVVSAPAVVLLPSPLAFEVGRAADLALEISGGDPPFTLTWSMVGAGPTVAETVATDGLAYVPVDLTEPGTFPASVVVVDALGVASANATETLEVDPPLRATATGVSDVGATVVTVNVSGSVVDGVPPIDWTVVPSAPAGNVSAGPVPLAGAGELWWNATYRLEGTLNASVVVVDADGGWTLVNLTIPLAPELAVSSSVAPATPGRVALTMTIVGGLGPYIYRWNDSAGDAWNGTAAGDGTVVLQEVTNRSGPMTFDLELTDALGATVTTQNRTTVTPIALPDPGAGSGAWLGIVAALAGGGGAAMTVLVRRRRGPSVVTAPPDPVATLRAAIEPSDGVDRGTVELLAEEQGVPLEVIRSTLERLKTEGTVRAERGDDGEEVLAWSDPPYP